MDHVRALITGLGVCFFACLVGLYSGDAFAVTPNPTVEYRCGTANPWDISKAAACNTEMVRRQQAATSGTVFITSTDPQCRMGINFNSGTTNSNWAVCTYMTRNVAPSCPPNSTLNAAQDDCTCNPGYSPNSSGTDCLPDPPPSCPANQTRVNGVCVPDGDCPEGQVRINGQCKPPQKCEPGKKNGDWWQYGPLGVTRYFCNAGCVAKATFDLGVPCGGDLGCTGYYSTAEGFNTGAECSGNSSPGSGPSTGPGGDPTDPGTGPGDGTGTGDGNGTGSGTGTGDGSGTGSSSPGTGNQTGGQGTNGSGAPTSPVGTPPNSIPSGASPLPSPAPVAGNSDGSCPAGTSPGAGGCYSPPSAPDADGKCPVGATKVGTVCVPVQGTPGGGGGAGSGGDGEGEGSGFGGNCAAGFMCQGGDAIQCAVAKEQYIRNCKFYDDRTESHAAKFFEVDGKQGVGTDELPGNETISIGSGNFDTTNALGGVGSGAQDLTVSIMGRSWSLPFSVINPYLAILGNILLGVAFLLSARIVARG